MTQYEAFRYVMQDMGHLYIGAKYTYRALLEEPDVNFKLKTIIEHYFLKDTTPEKTLEEEFYTLKEGTYLCRCFEQLKIKVKIFKRKEKVCTLKEFLQYPEEERAKEDFLVTELIFPKLALMSFVV